MRYTTKQIVMIPLISVYCRSTEDKSEFRNIACKKTAKRFYSASSHIQVISRNAVRWCGAICTQIPIFLLTFKVAKSENYWKYVTYFSSRMLVSFERKINLFTNSHKNESSHLMSNFRLQHVK